MTTVQIMDDMAAFIADQVKDFKAEHRKGSVPISVFPGYPPIRDRPEESESFIYVLVYSFESTADESTAKVEIAFSVYDNDKQDGWRTLANLMELVRQALLKKRVIAKKYSLNFPIKAEVALAQPAPNWEGKINAEYTVGNLEEIFDFDSQRVNMWPGNVTNEGSIPK